MATETYDAGLTAEERLARDFPDEYAQMVLRRNHREAGAPRSTPCIHLGPQTQEVVRCGKCPGNVRVKIYRCYKHNECILNAEVDGIRSCVTCADREVRRS